MKHGFTITAPTTKIPSNSMPDGALTGNGDLSVVWSSTTSDRIRFYIGKVDFWKASPIPETGGGHVPLGIIEVLVPHLPYSDYHIEEDIDNATLTGIFGDGIMDFKLKAVVCATENTILLEMDRSAPGLSVSVGLIPLSGNGAECEHKSIGNIEYATRNFKGEGLYFDTESIYVLREVSTRRENGREITRWSIHVSTNHDSAAYRENAINAAEAMDGERFDRLLAAHAAWWRRFWSVSSLELEDKELENHWYMGLYMMACCSRNKKFAPGLWVTSQRRTV